MEDRFEKNEMENNRVKIYQRKMVDMEDKESFMMCIICVFRKRVE